METIADKYTVECTPDGGYYAYLCNHEQCFAYGETEEEVLENLESECDTALQQIDDRMYAKEYEDDYDQILCYGISFFKKRCMVKKK